MCTVCLCARVFVCTCVSCRGGAVRPVAARDEGWWLRHHPAPVCRYVSCALGLCWPRARDFCVWSVLCSVRVVGASGVSRGASHVRVGDH